MKASDHINDAVLASPPVGVGGLVVFGYPLNDVVLVLTAVYTVFLIVDKAYGIYVKWKEKNV